MKYIDVSELKNKLEETPSIIIIDVRTSEEYQMGHVPQTKNISLDVILSDPEFSIQEFSHILEAQETIYIICLSDRRSFMACHKLMEYGIPNVCYIKGGTKAWSDAGYLLQKVNL